VQFTKITYKSDIQVSQDLLGKMIGYPKIHLTEEMANHPRREVNKADRPSLKATYSEWSNDRSNRSLSPSLRDPEELSESKERHTNHAIECLDG
jgi:hypothetical protein